MTSLKVIFRNTASNWFGFLFNILIQFLLTPFIIHSLGDTNYGIWILIMSITGYYGILDLGIRSGVGHYITRYHAKGEIEKVNNIITSAFFALSCIAILCIVITFVLAFFFIDIFDVKNTPTYLLRWTIILVGIGFSITFPFSVYSATISSLQRFDILSGIGVTIKIVHTILVVVVLKLNYGLLGLAIVTFITGLFGYFLQIIYGHKIFAELSIRIKYYSFSHVKEIGNYGIFSFLLLVSSGIISFTDTIVAAKFLDVTAVTYFTVPRMLIEYLYLLMSGFTQTLTPVATLNAALKKSDNLLKLFHYGSKLHNLLNIPLVLILYYWGHDFLFLWVGEKFVQGTIYHSSALILKILLVGYLIRSLNRVTWQVLFGIRKHKIPAIYTVFEAIANLILSILLVGKMGLVGVALGTAITSIISGGILIPLYSCKVMNIKFIDYISKIFKDPIIMVIIFSVTIFIIERVSPSDVTWLIFIIKVCIAVFCYVLLALFINIEDVKRLNFPEKLSFYKALVIKKIKK